MSVLRIYNNITAVNARRNLGVASMAIDKTIERISSGLRINRAADDAAGLSISEKLRGQIRGLNRASANALDGISRIQTAEGAMGEIHTILQRMRELAVQSANGIYTADDRLAIQAEISQLSDEINRIAETTEFNTKNLLDGTFTALVSTDNYERVQAAVLGDVGNGGNFVLKAVALNTGRLQVQKTDVFSTSLETDAVGQLNYLTTYHAGGIITTANIHGTGETGVAQVGVRNVAGNAVFSDPGSPGQLTMQQGGPTYLAQAGDSALENFQNHVVTRGIDQLRFTTYDATNGVLTHEITLTNANTASWNALATAIGDAMVANGGLALINVAGDVAFQNATGQLEIDLAAAAQLIDVEFVDVDGSGSEFYMNFTETAATVYRSNAFIRGIQYSFSNNDATTGLQNLTAFAGTSTYTIGDLGTTGQIDIRFDVTHDWSAITTGGNAQDTIEWDRNTGLNSLHEYGTVRHDGPVSDNATFLVSVVDELAFAVYEFDNNAYTSLVASGISSDIAQLRARGDVINDDTGSATHVLSSVFTGEAGSALENVHIAFSGILQHGETATFNLSTSNVLTADQNNTLASITRFSEFGVFDGRNTVDFQIYLEGRSGSIQVNLAKNDTLEDLTAKISLALWNPGETALFESDVFDISARPDLVHLNTIGVAKGTISITAPLPGVNLVFAGDESLLKALSLVEVQAGIAPLYSISAMNLETGKALDSVEVSSNQINGLIPGLKILFDNSLGIRLDANPPLADANSALTSFAFLASGSRPVISLSNSVDSFFIHVAPRGSGMQVGANQGQMINLDIAEMTTAALDLEGVLVVTSELAQESISRVDHAIAYVSAERSKLGAIQNRLESTIRNLDVSAENLTSSESRIRDADFAEETVKMTRGQILIQASISALAQANQLPSMVLQLLG